jgi:DNA-binding CsgD family transcriptional regulator/tetratricopeptide (TPR) repeat protein
VAGALPLVGRRVELTLLTEVLTRGSASRAVVLVGEAGVGKTRLVAEAIRRARAAGGTVLAGNCLPLTDSVPFLPVTEALRTLGRVDGTTVPPPVLQRCAPDVRAELARLVPGWGPAPAPAGREPDEHDLVEGWRRGRLFAALRDLLAAVAADGPCALVVEDLHWADATTLDFLAYLTAVDRDGVTPLVMTCREEEIDPKRPVGRWYAELARQHGVTLLLLARLSRPEVAQQISGLLGAAAPSSFVDEVVSRAGGNAFFTEQLVTAAVRDTDGPRPGVGLPASLAQLLIARADAVGDDGREVLSALAVAGRGLNDTVLMSVTGLDRDRLGAAVRDLADARLIDRPRVDGRYQLRHALVGEAVAADMLAGERRARHAVVARKLIANAAADGAGEVAEHWGAADAAAEEVPWRRAAAKEAEQVYAYREAANHWQRLIDLWPRVSPDSRPAGVDLATVYLNALAALDRCGDSRTARPLAEEAVHAVAATADPRKLALLYDRVSTYRWVDDEEAALEPLQIALQLLADLPAGREHAMVLHSYAQRVLDISSMSAARPYLDQALHACRAAGSAADDIKIKVLRDLSVCAMHEGDIDTGTRQLAEAATLAEQHRDPLAAAGVAFLRAEDQLVLGHLEQAAAAAQSGLEAARRAGLERHPNAEFMAYCHFEALAELGRPAEAEPVLPATTESTRTSAASLARAHLDLLIGDAEAATSRLAQIEAVSAAGNLTVGAGLLTPAEIELWTHRPADALTRIRQTPTGIDPAFQMGYIGPILRTAMRACADLAETARARRDTAAEAEARRSAQDLVDAHATVRPDPFATHPYWTTAPAEGATWAAELTRVAGTPDPDAWAAAAVAWTGLGRPHRVGYARWRQAEALLHTVGRTEHVRECLREAATAANGHVPLLTEIRSLARIAGLDLYEQQPRAVAALVAQPPPYQLTDKEMSVLKLLAEGLTNKQIGARLFMANKTASVHVTHILSKLGVKNRAEAAAVAQRAGLLGPE